MGKPALHVDDEAHLFACATTAVNMRESRYAQLLFTPLMLRGGAIVHKGMNTADAAAVAAAKPSNCLDKFES
jgi:hypothetical protein